MKYTIINAASKTAIEVMKAYWKKYPVSSPAALNLLDIFPRYADYKNLFKAIDSQAFPGKASIEKASNKYYVEQILRNTDYLIYFTHQYYENVTCKNQLMSSVGEMLKGCPNVKKAVFVNLLEFSQTNDKDYLKKALEAERQIVEACPQAHVIWSDFCRDDDASLISFLKNTPALRYPSNASDNQKWTSVEKVADCLNLLISGEATSKLNYVGATDKVSTGQLLADLSCQNVRLTIDYSRDDVFTDLFSTAEYRNYLRLLGNSINLEHELHSYSSVLREKEALGVDKVVGSK